MFFSRELAGPLNLELHTVYQNDIFHCFLCILTGTSPGGVQLQTFKSVGRRQHASLSGLALTHGVSLYVTVVARNAAGLTSVLYSQPMTVDMTPPVIGDLKDGSSGMILCDTVIAIIHSKAHI